MKIYQLSFIFLLLRVHHHQTFTLRLFVRRITKILLRQPDEIIFLHKPQGEKGSGSATDDGKFIKHFIGIAVP